jgi:hypothetical protein
MGRHCPAVFLTILGCLRIDEYGIIRLVTIVFLYRCFLFAIFPVGVEVNDLDDVFSNLYMKDGFTVYD